MGIVRQFLEFTAYSKGKKMKNITVKLLPLLFLFLLMVLLFSSPDFQGDEGGYVAYATRLSQGEIYPLRDVSLWWGPGYPIVLIPFVLFKLPLLFAKFLNAFFLFGALLYFYEALAQWVNKTHATLFTFLLGFYPPLWREVHLLITENLVFFLICGFIFHFAASNRGNQKSRFHLVMASFFLGYLALTKVFYGYVILIGLLSFLFFYTWQKKEWFKKTTYIYLLALVWCLPYLLYTYSLTNKIFYWGTSGGSTLYWMSSPYSGDLGDWQANPDVEKLPDLERHREFFATLTGISEVEVDNKFKERALQNIVHNPKKYLLNWMANIGRLLFSYPFSYTQQKITTFFYLIPNMFVVVGFILSIYPAILKRKAIPYEMYVLLYFCFIAFGGTSLLSAYDRQFRPLVPILLLWIAFIYTRILTIQLRPDSEIKSD